jgi:hypothetical protein
MSSLDKTYRLCDGDTSTYVKRKAKALSTMRRMALKGGTIKVYGPMKGDARKVIAYCKGE